jgi:hypothetical protein
VQSAGGAFANILVGVLYIEYMIMHERYHITNNFSGNLLFLCKRGNCGQTSCVFIEIDVLNVIIAVIAVAIIIIIIASDLNFMTGDIELLSNQIF